LPFWHYADILRTGESTLYIQKIDANEGAQEAEQYDKEWQDRLDKDKKLAEAKKELDARMHAIGDDSIHTKKGGSAIIPLDLLIRLAMWQRKLGKTCRIFRFIKIVLTWEESIISFWITACFLVTGLLSLLLPWSYLLLWTGRAFVWGLLGPHMALARRIFLHQELPDDQALKLAIEKFRKDSRLARVRHQDALKLKDIKSHYFGEYSTLVPSYNLSRHYDHPLSCSFATARRSSDPVRVSSSRIPGQQFFGAIIPRPQSSACQFESELPRLKSLLESIQQQVKQIQVTENSNMIKRLREISSEDEREAVGFELISLEHGGSDASERTLRLGATSSLVVNTDSHVAVLTEKRASINRRSSEHLGVEMIPFEDNGGEREDKGEELWGLVRERYCGKPHELSLSLSPSTALMLNSVTRLAILQVEEDGPIHVDNQRSSTLRHSLVDVVNSLEAIHEEEENDVSVEEFLGIEVVLLSNEEEVPNDGDHFDSTKCYDAASEVSTGSTIFYRPDCRCSQLQEQ
jgi:hypothetical protein